MTDPVPSKDLSSERIAELIEDRQRFVTFLEVGDGDPDLDDALSMARDLVTALKQLQLAHEPASARKPDGYAYRFRSIGGEGTFISFEMLGRRDAIETIPYWLGTAQPPGDVPNDGVSPLLDMAAKADPRNYRRRPPGDG